MAKLSFSAEIKGGTSRVSLDNTQQDDIKEKAYFTKQIDSSIALLDSPEDDVVLEALLYLSQYADVQLNNLNHKQQHFLLNNLLNLLHRNVCILRLVLRLLGVLLRMDDAMIEFDQDIYDDKILKIANLYVSHEDGYIKQFCLSILSKLAETCRINCLIFKTDLFNPLLETIQKRPDTILLQISLELFLKLLNSPAALGILPDIYSFDVSILLIHLEDEDKNIAELSFEIILKLTSHGLNVFQQMFREVQLVEKMLVRVMDPEQRHFHQVALKIINNCVKSQETSNYFIETGEFLKFCQWVKTCEQEYLYPCVSIFNLLTKAPSNRQALNDLSAEESILYFLRSSEKHILNQTCQAISNMTTHKYCSERMLTPAVLREIGNMLLRKDEEDPGNEIALKTIFDFSRRNVNALDMMHTLGIHKTLLALTKKGNVPISEESFLMVLEILYKMSLHPLYQKDVADTSFFQKLLHLFQVTPTDGATFVCEILTNFVDCTEFRRVFLSMNGPQIFVGALQTSKEPKLLKNVLLFIHSILIYEKVVRSFLQNNLVRVLKGLPAEFRAKAPIMAQMLKLVYSIHLPLKLYETQRLDVIEKLENRFYLINGSWRGPFPFLEILEANQVSPICIIYFVDYSREIMKITDEGSLNSEYISAIDKVSSETELSTKSTETVNVASNSFQSQFEINEGRLSVDMYLPRYIYHFTRQMEEVNTMEDKIKMLAEYVDILLSGPMEETLKTKIQIFKMHIKSLKVNLGSSMIPIGYLRLGFHCERSLLFKAIGDKCGICTSLVKGVSKIYWNEVALINFQQSDGMLKLYVVDLMDNIGNLMLVGSRAADQYCSLKMGV